MSSDHGLSGHSFAFQSGSVNTGMSDFFDVPDLSGEFLLWYKCGPPWHLWFLNTPILKSHSASLFPPLSRATMRATQTRPTSHTTAITVSRRRKWIRRLFGLYLLLTQRTHTAKSLVWLKALWEQQRCFSATLHKIRRWWHFMFHGLDDGVIQVGPRGPRCSMLESPALILFLEANYHPP